MCYVAKKNVEEEDMHKPDDIEEAKIVTDDVLASRIVLGVVVGVVLLCLLAIAAKC